MICEEAICNVAYILHGRDSFEKVKEVLDVPQTLSDIAKPLIDLFFYYSVQMECIDQFNLMSVDCYMNKSACTIDTGLIDNKIGEIRKGLVRRGITENTIDKLLDERKAKYPYNVKSLLTIVSGKDFIIPYFRHHINRCLHCSIKLPKEAWKFNLFDRCDINRLDSLKQAILSA